MAPDKNVSMNLFILCDIHDVFPSFSGVQNGLHQIC
jgi:hypothetical protein